jgi:phosphoserine phosphatase RsbU/P
MQNVQSKTILVIDDDITIRKLISHHLLSNKFNVLAAEKAEDAFKILDENSVDLVLCDVTLGNMDGFTFCENVRKNEKHRLIPFVFVTAKSSLKDKSKGMEVGGDDFITKPFDVDELLLKVRALLRRSEIYKTFGARRNVEDSFSVKTPLIVLIDDDVSLSKMFQYNLRKAGFECLVANTPIDGFELVKNTIPDVIISDIMMPEVDGFELRKLILNEPTIKSIPFIFLTAKGTEKDILDGYELDITDYVLKTAGPKVITAKVSAIIKSLSKEKAKAVQELHRAADSMRVKVVPDFPPQFDGFKINHWYEPFGGIPGGDFLDYILLDQNRLAIILGDVMGKKWGAWFFALAYAGYIRSAIRSVLQAKDSFLPGNILKKVNKAVYHDSKISEVFTTLSVLILDKKKSEASYSGAGDLPLLYKSSSEDKLRKINSDGLLLGFSSKTEYTDSIVPLSAGDFILLTTDGIIESRDKNEQQYGAKKFVEFVNTLKSSDDLINSIKSDFNKFTEGNIEDDISLISVTVN